MNKFGYRVKLNDYLYSEDIYINFLKKYFELFELCEIKINRKLINFDKSYEFISYLLQSYGDRVSFHFDKMLINEEKILNIIEKEILQIIDNMDNIYNINCITHFNTNFMDQEYVNKIIDYSQYFDSKKILTLENPVVELDTIDYLKNISEVIHKVNEKSSDVRLCLDIGHLCFYEQQYSKIVSTMIKEKLFDFIIEYHIHNVSNEIDHRTPENGKIDYHLWYDLIKKHSPNSKVILECEVNEMEIDGINNILVLKNK